MTRPTRPPRPPQRVAWFEGAPLERRDLRDAIAHEARMLDLHVSATHRTWGVALGYTIASSDDRRQIVVAPGLAYTCRGEALVLAQGVRLDAPRSAPGVNGPQAFDLVVAPAPPSESRPCELIVACDGVRPVRRIGLRWEFAGVVGPGALDPPLAAGIRLGEDVPIARFFRFADGLLGLPDYAVRRIARWLTRPHVAFGVAGAGELAWQVQGHRLVATVDTSAHGFTTIPRYFVSLSSSPAIGGSTVGAFVHVEAANATWLRAGLAFAARPQNAPTLAALLASSDAVRLMWVGVEMARGCPPSLIGSPILTLAGAMIDPAPWLASLALLGALDT